MNTIFIWLILSLFFLTFEFGHPGLFFFLSFAIGSSVSLIITWFNFPITAQMYGFFIGTVIALLFLRSYVKLIQKRTRHHTNVYALIGKNGVVTHDISIDNPGYVKVLGELWLARTTNNNLEVGNHIIVKDVRGAHLLVEAIDPFNL